MAANPSSLLPKRLIEIVRHPVFALVSSNNTVATSKEKPELFAKQFSVKFNLSAPNFLRSTSKIYGHILSKEKLKVMRCLDVRKNCPVLVNTPANNYYNDWYNNSIFPTIRKTALCSLEKKIIL